MKNNFLKKINFRYLIYAFVILSSLCIYLFDFKQKMLEFSIDNKKYIIYFLIISLVIAIIVFSINIFLKKKKSMPICKMYLFLSLILGFLYLIIIPVLAQSDESAHFFKSYEVASGINILNKDAGQLTIPESVVDTVYYGVEDNSAPESKRYYDIPKMLDIKLNEDVMHHNYVNTTKYPYINYIPQGLGMFIGKIFNFSPYILGFLGKLFNLIICVIITYFAIKKLPDKKLLFSLLLLSPVSLSYMASLSADGMIISLAFIYISYIYYYIKKKEKITKLDLVIILISGISTAICKTAYVPILLLIFFLPKESIQNNKRKLLMFLSMVVFFFCWILMIKSKGSLETTINNVNVLEWLIHNPIQYCGIILRSIYRDGYYYIENMFAGNFLCHGQVAPYSIIPLTYIVIVIIALFNEKSNVNITNLQKTISVLIIMVAFFLISSAMYFYNTIPSQWLGYPYIIGVQGRYFIPVLPLLIFLFNRKVFDLDNYKILNVCVILNMLVFLTMIIKFSF